MFRHCHSRKLAPLHCKAVLLLVLQGTYLFALPGSPSACKDAWDDLVHQPDYRHRPAILWKLCHALSKVV